MIDSLKGVRGGIKHKILGERRVEILAFMSEHGIPATREEYCMRKDTWDRFISSERRPANLNDKQRDRLLLGMALDCGHDNTRRIRALEANSYTSNFTYYISSANKHKVTLTSRNRKQVNKKPVLLSRRRLCCLHGAEVELLSAPALRHNPNPRKRRRHV